MIDQSILKIKSQDYANIPEAFFIVKREKFPVLIDLIGLINCTGFINWFEVSDNQYQNLSFFPALV